MKIYILILFVIIVSIGLTNESYSAKDTLPPDPRWIMYCNGTVEGIVEDLPRTYERSNLDSVILEPETYNFNFYYDEFVPGKDFNLKWFAKTIDNREDAFIKIRFKDVAGNDTTIEFFHYAKKISVRPNLDFGIINIGESKEMECWIKCESTVTDTLSRLRLKYDNQGFEILGINLPIVIRTGDSIKFNVRFNATKDGIFKDSIGLEAFFYDEFLASIRAEAGSTRIVVSNSDFGDVPLLQTKHSISKIENFGTLPHTIIGFKGPNYPNNFIPDLPDINKINPLVIEPNESYSFYVSFWPTEEVSYKDSIVFINESGAVNSSDCVAELSGRGIIVGNAENLKNEDEINIFPNPTDEFIIISFNEDIQKPFCIKLFDPFGIVVYVNRDIIKSASGVTPGTVTIRTSEFASGMYFLQIGNEVVRKVLVVH